ncbi:MAG: methylglyoxal synthase [Acetivibrionales bacterium]|jgi:methylglyoxal synthase|nr:methylglyoxal synthase [Bacillota bacterium]NLP07173.1 methylglyoxal synthase [Clostridiaceae bacterium]
MNIALIADDNKKELMVDLCIAYKTILRKHTLYSTGTTASFISEGAGLPVYGFSPGALGGAQQIAARVSLNEIDMVLFLRDPTMARDHGPDIHTLLRLCDKNNVPFATNIATAEILIKGLERGDLQWREHIR